MNIVLLQDGEGAPFYPITTGEAVTVSIDGASRLLDETLESITARQAAQEESIAGVESDIGTLSRVVTATTILYASSWSSEKTQTVAVEGMTSTCAVVVSPDDNGVESWASNLVRASSQGSGTLTFRAGTLPSEDITVNVVFFLPLS